LCHALNLFKDHSIEAGFSFDYGAILTEDAKYEKRVTLFRIGS